MDIGISEIVALVSALVAVVSLGFNIIVVRRQIALQAEEVGAAVDAEKVRWMARALDLFAEAETLATLQNDAMVERALDVAARFSTHADAGRLYFPNIESESAGARDFAFSGRRHPVIDTVVLAHDLTRELPRLDDAHDEAARRLMWRCRRILVSEVQRSVDPRRREEAIEAQTRRGSGERAASYEEIHEVVAAARKLPLSKLSFT